MSLTVYDRLSGSYDECVLKSDYYRTQRTAELTFFQRYVPTLRDHHRLALDIGCGPGTYACLLLDSGYDVTAIDISDSMVRLASEAMERKLAQVNTNPLPRHPYAARVM